MAKVTFELEWDDDLGEQWMNIFNLRHCLYSSDHTKEELVRVKEVKPPRKEKMTEIRKKICDIVSKMLDNPDENGIYPTSIAYNELEKLVAEKQIEAVGWTYAQACNYLDKGKDLRNESVPNILDEWLKVKK